MTATASYIGEPSDLGLVPLVPVPSFDTAQRVYALLRERSGLNIKDLLPTLKQRRKLSPEIATGVETKTMQALVLVLDTAIASAGHGNFFYSMVWDALASRWSATYLGAIERGPERWSRDMDKKTGRAVDRDLVASGLNFYALLSAAKNGYGLYTTEHDYRGFIVTMNYDADLWRTFEDIVKSDGEYHRSRELSRLRLALVDGDTTADRKRLLPAGNDEWSGARTSYSVASGFAYDIAKPGTRRNRAMETYERTTIYLDVDAFIKDVERLGRKHPKILRADFASYSAWQWARKEAGPAWLKTDGRLNSWKAIREQLRTTPRDEWGQVAIRSNYKVVINGRFQNLDFWLPDVPSSYRKRWFRMETRAGERLPAVGRDISSSQLWVLAVLLGDTDLEKLLERSFWKLAARRLWDQHKDRLDGFKGRISPELVASCKTAVMTHIYGSPLTEVVEKLAEDPEEFGPGLDLETIKLLIEDPELHLDKCLKWYLPACRKMARVAQELSPRRGFTFVDPLDKDVWIWNPLRTRPCRIAGNKRVEIYGEAPARQIPVPVVDPHTGKRLMGHDIAAMAGRPGGMQKGDALEGTFLGLREVKVPGHKPRRLIVWKDLRFVSADGTQKKLSDLKLSGIVGHEYPEMNLEGADYEVWLSELEKRIAPCIAHHMDADFCAHVTEGLVNRGVINIVPVHDGWYVAADDESALPGAIEDAGEEFLKDLGPSILAAFGRYLRNDPQYGPEVRKMLERWAQRVGAGEAGAWPKFRSKPVE
ncbi:MAG TPA: hypothetical protein VGS01_11435 [Candidatus Limnocylindria bacterium]|jgi:hypothetical protein|nr:hypothetical protein [Candidatus Limnocylindria bacterium]